MPVDTWSLNLQGQANWQNVPTNGSSPNGGWGMTSVYDARGDRMLIFGGSTSDNYYGAKNDVWELDLHGNPHWNQVVTAGTSPPARRSGAAIFDSIRNRMIIYGGFDAVPNSDKFLADAWALDFNASPPVWSQLSPAGVVPHGRDALPAAYDPIHDRMIVYGGWSGTDMLGEAVRPRPSPAIRQPTRRPRAGAGRRERRGLHRAERPRRTGRPGPRFARQPPIKEPATGTHAAIYRCDPGGQWSARAEGEVDPAGHLVYDDAAVQAGLNYSYMMVVGSQRGETFGGQTNVLVPTTTAVDPGRTVDFALTGVSPNPAIDLMSVSFNLASAEPASLALLDVAGRSWLNRDLGSLGAGSHRIDLATAGRVPPGLYFVRLTQAGRVASNRLAVAGGR